jgi:hypothetical protein
VGCRARIPAVDEPTSGDSCRWPCLSEPSRAFQPFLEICAAHGKNHRTTIVVQKQALRAERAAVLLVRAALEAGSARGVPHPLRWSAHPSVSGRRRRNAYFPAEMMSVVAPENLASVGATCCSRSSSVATLEGTSEAEMFTSGTAVEGSAGYVARERITGVLHGKQGSFAVLHLGTMPARLVRPADRDRARLGCGRARGDDRLDEDRHRAGRQAFLRDRLRLGDKP